MHNRINRTKEEISITNQYEYFIVHEILQSSRGDGLVTELNQWIEALIQPLANTMKTWDILLQPHRIHLASSILEDYFLWLSYENSSHSINQSEKRILLEQTVITDWAVDLPSLFQYMHVPLASNRLKSMKLGTMNAWQNLSVKFEQWLKALAMHDIDHYQLVSLKARKEQLCYQIKTLANHLTYAINRKGNQIDKKEELLLLFVASINSIIDIVDADNNEPDYSLKALLEKSFTEILARDPEDPSDCKYSWLSNALIDYLSTRAAYKKALFYNTNIIPLCENILNPHRITVLHCSALEDTLLMAAGIDLSKKIECCTSQFSDVSRLHLTFNNLTPQDAHAIRVFTKQYDKTAELHHTQNGAFQYLMTCNPQYFYEQMLPIFDKKFAERLKNPDYNLAIYQEKSANYFKQLSLASLPLQPLNATKSTTIATVTITTTTTVDAITATPYLSVFTAAQTFQNTFTASNILQPDNTYQQN